MKRGYIVILIVLWALAFASFIGDRESKDVDIVTAFSNDSFLSTTSHIEAVAMYGNLYLSEDAKKDILCSVASDLGIKDGYTISSDETSVTLIKPAKYAITEIKFVSVKAAKDKGVERQYLMTDISILNSLESAVLYRDKIDIIYDKMGLLSDVTLTLKGNIDGKMSAREKEDVCDAIIGSLDAKLVTDERQNDIYTVFAYSKGIDDYVFNGDEKVNINVAISYDENNDETYVYMATPIINEDY